MAKNVTTDLGANNLVADGTTDNTAALNAAMAAATLPVAWYFPGGTYVLKSQPNAVPTGFTWYGDGVDVTVIKGTRTSTSGNAVLTCAGTTQLTLRDLTLTTTDDANACNQVLNVSGATGVNLVRVKMSNGYACHVRGASPGQVNAVQCEFTSCHQDPTASFFSGVLQNSTFTNCNFHDNNAASVNTQHAVYLNGGTSASTTPTNVVFSSCTFTNINGGSVFEVQGVPGSWYAQGLAINNCTFAPGLGASSCVIAQAIQGLTLTGNTIVAASGTNGFQLYGQCDGFTITGNVMSQNQGASPYFGSTFVILGGGPSPVSSGIIASNIVTQPIGTYGFSCGVASLACNNVQIRGNRFEGLYADVLLQTTSTTNVDIKDNHFLIAAGSTDGTTGGKGYFGQSNFARGVGIDGPVSGVIIGQNRFVGKNANVQLVQYNYVGPATNVRFNDQNGFVIP